MQSPELIDPKGGGGRKGGSPKGMEGQEYQFRKGSYEEKEDGRMSKARSWRPAHLGEDGGREEEGT